MRASEEDSSRSSWPRAARLYVRTRACTGTHFGPVNATTRNQYFFYTEPAVSTGSTGRSPRQRDLHQAFPRSSSHVSARRRALPTHAFIGYDLVSPVGGCCPDGRSSTRCTSSSRSATGRARWCAPTVRKLCTHASPRRCNECFPEHLRRSSSCENDSSIPPRHVDLFLAPSPFLLERYVEWGIPQDRIQFEEYGRRTVQRIIKSEDREPDAVLSQGRTLPKRATTWSAHQPVGNDEPSEPRQGRSGLLQAQRPPDGQSSATETSSARNRVGFFGQLNSLQGLNVLMEAMTILDDAEATPTSGSTGPTSTCRPSPYQNRFAELLEEKARTTWPGATTTTYRR